LFAPHCVVVFTPLYDMCPYGLQQYEYNAFGEKEAAKYIPINAS
jgi:hypothetical protein